MKIFTKVFLSHAMIGILSVVTLSFIYYFHFRDALVERTLQQLSSINILKKDQVEQSLQTTISVLQYVASHHLADGDHGLSKAQLASLRGSVGLDALLLTDSSFNTISFAGDDSSGVAFIRAFHQNKDGWRTAARTPGILSDAHFEDAFLLVVPVQQEHQYLFALKSKSDIQKILDEATGMGSSGETYIVAADTMMVTNSRFNRASSKNKILVNTAAAKNGLAGRDGGGVVTDYRGVEVLSYYRKMAVPFPGWAVITEIDLDEATAALSEMRRYFLLVSAIILLLIIAVTAIISRSLSAPIIALKKIVLGLSLGILPDRKITDNDRSEIGQMAEAINTLSSNIRQTTIFASEIGTGNFDTSFTLLSDQDLLGKSLVRMKNELRNITSEKIKLVQEKATAIQHGQLEEQKRIVRDLHDGVGQLLTVVGMKIAAIENQPQLKEVLAELIHETANEIKRISYNLLPNALVDFGLEAAVGGLIEKFRKYNSGIAVDFAYIKEDHGRMNFEISLSVFRIVQETLNNILKHSKATEASLHFVENAGELYFFVGDNGSGFAVDNELTRGSGLTNMRDRVQALNGTIEISSESDKGTSIEVSIPLVLADKI